MSNDLVPKDPKKVDWEIVDDTSITEWMSPGKYNPHHVTAEQVSTYTNDPNYVPPIEPREPFDAEAERQRIFDRMEYRTAEELYREQLHKETYPEWVPKPPPPSIFDAMVSFFTGFYERKEQHVKPESQIKDQEKPEET